MNPQTFIFIGRSGCGKGTQADLLTAHLCEHDNLCKTLHIETGSFLREFVKGDSYTQKLSKKILDEGALMPESVMVALWENYLFDNYTGKENLIFDGAPRKLHEAQLLDSALKFYSIKKPNIIYMNVSREWSEKRLLGRARKDDKPEVIERRLDWFDSEVMPTVNFYKNNSDYNFLDINGEQTIEEVNKEIIAKLKI
ncbi:MAG: nucleoside monophosphate kinase [Parcubacteria group bacterium]|nr:nucleoside monophosphate kinase [Parcubacteria group bacterium]